MSATLSYILFSLLIVFHFIASSQTVTFNFTGAVQSWTVPPCVTSLSVTLAGAEGGGTVGGNGAVVTGTIAVTPGQVLNIYVGGSGNCPQAGWNGGGNGQNANSTANRSCGGGGATDIRIGGTALSNRVIVASGGGGMGGGTADATGGAGGCATGATGVNSFGGGGTGGTQTSGGNGGTPWGSGQQGSAGSLGQGANGAVDNCYNNSPGGGGGGGFYGGGSGGADCFSSAPYGGGAGGGGSSLTPAGGGCTSGSNNGAGYCTITYTIGAGTATATNTGPYCVGATIQLNATGGTPTSTYAWTGPNGFTSALQNPSIASSTTLNAGTYNLTVTSTGCVANATTTVVVNPIPIVNAGLDQAVCQGTNVTLTGTGATTYSWTGGVTQGVTFAPPLGNNTYTLTGTTSGCTATDQVSVMVNPIPTVNAGADQTVCSGTAVTLSGSGTATTYTWNSGVTDVVSFTPLSTATYTVTGTGIGGCTSTDDVIVTVNPIPVVDAGTDVIACDGAAVTLTASGADTYNWNNSVIQGVGFTPTIGSVVYTVIGTTNAGCSASDDVTVTVNSNPTPVINGDLIYCSPSPPTLATTEVYATYSWSTGSTNPTITATQADNPVTITVTNAEGCSGISPAVNLTENNIVNSSGSMTICEGETALIHGNSESVAGDYIQTFTTSLGCDSTSTITLNVNPLPNVNAGIDQSICSGTSVTVSGSGAMSYSWNNGVSNGVPFTPVGDVTIICTGTDLNGCVNSDEVVITVNPNPSVNAGNDQAVCAGSSITLAGSGANSYSWNNAVSDNVSFVPMSTTAYTVVGTTAAGCTGTDQVVVTVNSLPTVNSGLDQVVCEGATVTLVGSGATTYSWNNDVSNGISFIPSVGTTTYTVTGTSLGCIDTDQVVVTVNPNPVVSFIADQTIGCTPLTVNFTNTSLNATNCSWSFTNGSTQVGCNSVEVTFEQGGCFDVTLTTTSSGGCVGAFTAFDMICAEEPPIASFSPNPQEIGMFDPLVNFNNTSIGAETYFWDFGDDSSGSTEENPEHMYPNEQSGNYDVMLIAASPLGCLDTAYSFVEVVEELIYYVPNTFTPDNDIFNQTFEPVFTSGFDPYDYELLIFNRWGQIIFESHDHRIGWDGSYGTNSDIKTCQEGVYTWRIEFKIRNNDERKIISGHVNLLR
jgi:gliding motility-associated-like protein